MREVDFAKQKTEGEINTHRKQFEIMQNPLSFSPTDSFLIRGSRDLEMQFYSLSLKMFHVKQRKGQARKPVPPAVDVGVKEKDMVS